jgi:hypothetical protein
MCSRPLFLGIPKTVQFVLVHPLFSMPRHQRTGEQMRKLLKVVYSKASQQSSTAFTSAHSSASVLPLSSVSSQCSHPMSIVWTCEPSSYRSTHCDATRPSNYILQTHSSPIFYVPWSITSSSKVRRCIRLGMWRRCRFRCAVLSVHASSSISERKRPTLLLRSSCNTNSYHLLSSELHPCHRHPELVKKYPVKAEWYMSVLLGTSPKCISL